MIPVPPAAEPGASAGGSSASPGRAGARSGRCRPVRAGRTDARRPGLAGSVAVPGSAGLRMGLPGLGTGWGSWDLRCRGARAGGRRCRGRGDRPSVGGPRSRWERARAGRHRRERPPPGSRARGGWGTGGPRGSGAEWPEPATGGAPQVPGPRRTPRCARPDRGVCRRSAGWPRPALPPAPNGHSPRSRPAPYVCVVGVGARRVRVGVRGAPTWTDRAALWPRTRSPRAPAARSPRRRPDLRVRPREP